MDYSNGNSNGNNNELKTKINVSGFELTRCISNNLKDEIQKYYSLLINLLGIGYDDLLYYHLKHAFITACEVGNLDHVKQLSKYAPESIDVALYQSSRHGHFEIVKYLCEELNVSQAGKTCAIDNAKYVLDICKKQSEFEQILKYLS